MKNIFKFILAIILPFAAGAIGQFYTLPSITTWYATLVKPSFNPPNGIFAPVWTTLYILIGISFYLFWTKKAKNKTWGYVLFFAQLILNACWSIVFFGAHNTFGALIVIGLLWLSILLTIINFVKVSKIAGYILLPYLIWVSFAALLNFEVFILNR